MATHLSISTAGLTLAIVIVLGYLCYHAALPRPIPGLPYNKRSAGRILGDAPDLLKHKADHGEMYAYLAKLASAMQEPVIQVFVQPLTKPWVIVSDPRECHDIMTRRAREFDRSKFFGQVFTALLPKFHVSMETGDDWHAHRRLVSDTMTPAFLNEVAGPQMWRSTLGMIELWKEKARLAQGRPIEAKDDVHNTTLDIIWAGTFGGEIGPNRARVTCLAGIQNLDLAGDLDQSVEFPSVEDPPSFRAIITLVHSMTIPLNSLFPYAAHWLALNTRSKFLAARS